MKIIRIFGEINRSVLSVQFEGQSQSAYASLFANWTDMEYLYEFFTSHQDDLKSGFFGAVSIEDAVERTVDEAEQLEALLLNIAVEGETNPFSNLQTLFKPLHNQEYTIRLHQKSKLTGQFRKSWLRMYAIRIAPNTYVVTGGAIKLTATMNDREHLKLELRKLEVAKNYLAEIGLVDENDVEYLELA